MRLIPGVILQLGMLALAASASARAGDDAIKAGGTSPAVAVIDGRSLIVDGTAYRLHGIDAPDLAQNCLIGHKSYPCGEIARDAMLDLVTGGRIRCTPVAAETGAGTDDAGRRLARCFADGFDIAGNMAHTGWAVVVPGEDRRYAPAQARARKARRGLWRGPFVHPAAWRRAQDQTNTEPQICVRGRLTERGVECQTMRSTDGTLYSFAGGRVVEGEVGAELCACGVPSAMSFCQQGQTLVVATILPRDACK